MSKNYVVETLGIKYCRRKRCEECPVKDFCGFEMV
jgi:endonuclease III